ncbi:MAG: cytochrome c [Acidobacteria bacterium]|nr:cytochrome c [Acidobacteriota bacterium]MBV8891925.1 cytochrome c [Acidobacteriota bacterium]MBV9482331.1 cytochrome c [Acidobacteriota bacterium]
MGDLRQLAALVALVLLAGCRQDMHNQPRFKPLAESDFYGDLRSARPPVEGTVARGELQADSYYATGMLAGTSTPGDYMPFPITRQVLDRGRERFDIYCAPCHSRLGDGNGIVPTRGFARKPPSFHIERLRKAPLGYFFDVMTHGFGMMPDYASQISAADRWAIVAYVRALQFSQNATRQEIPAGQAVPSPPPEFRGEPPNGGVLPELKPPTAAEERK